MIAALVAGLLAGYGVALPVGAVATYLLALTARTSLRIGAFAALGVATADGLYALLAVLGGGALARELRPITVPLRWVSVFVLLALAVRGTVTALRTYRARQTPSGAGAATPPSPTRAYLGLLGITVTNPTTMIYFTALVLGIQSTTTAQETTERLSRVLFVIGAFVASANWQLLLAGGGALLGRALTGSRGRLLTALASGALIAFLAVRLLVGLVH